MRNIYKIYLWENGQRSTDYTSHTIQPIFIEDKLDETLDTGEIILEKMPLATKDLFPPKTKIRIEQYEGEDFEGEPFKLDMVVEHDDVEEYVGSNYCTHRINLIEASVVAQGMHVDNIALTYELQDVTLNYRTTTESTDKILDGVVATPGGYQGGT